jgi:chemotaxis family two-component system response regulator Rcp1
MKPHALNVVLIEDNSADVFLITRALQQAGLHFHLRTFKNGEDAITFVRRLDQDAAPDLFLVDWNLPRVHGKEILQAMGRSAYLTHTPRIVLTSSESLDDKTEVERLGGVFFSKPRSLDEFMQIGSRIKSMLGV